MPRGYQLYRVHIGLLPAPLESVGKLLGGPRAGNACGKSGMVDISAVNLSRGHRFVKSIRFHLKLSVDHVLADLWDLFLELIIQ